MGKAFAGLLQPVAQQMLAEACALLLAEGAAQLDRAEMAQGSDVSQRDLLVKCIAPSPRSRDRFVRACRGHVGRPIHTEDWWGVRLDLASNQDGASIREAA